jgi:glutathione S-transferase
MRLYDYAASANCLKVRLLLAQLGRPYERVPVDIFAGETLTDDFGRLNPSRTTPVLQLEDGRALPESNAILAYLAEGTELLPDDPFERAQVLRWLLFEQADLVHAIAGLRFRLRTGRLEPHEPEAERRRARSHAVLSLLDGDLTDRPFLTNRYTIADIALFGYTHVAPEAGLDLAPYPHVEAWLERVRAQPGHVNDLEPYPANARPGAGRSIYD